MTTSRPVNVDIIIPRVDTPMEAIKLIDVESRTMYVYSGLMLAGAIDGQIVELYYATQKRGLLRFMARKCVSEMQRNMEAFKRIMFHTNDPDMDNKLNLALDAMDDEFENKIKILYLTVRQYILDSVGDDPRLDSDVITLLARANTIEILSQYSLFNDDVIGRKISKATFRNVNLKSKHMVQINHHAKRYTEEICRQTKKVNINFNASDSIRKAFEAIDKHILTIPELIRTTLDT
jgi:hypothetical protein